MKRKPYNSEEGMEWVTLSAGVGQWESQETDAAWEDGGGTGGGHLHDKELPSRSRILGRLTMRADGAEYCVPATCPASYGSRHYTPVTSP